MRGRGDPTVVIRNGTLIDAHEAEIMVRLGGYAALEAIVAFTANGAFALGLEDEPGVLAEGRLADAIILDRDPLADIAVPRGGAHLTTVIKDGKVIDRAGRATANARLTFEDDAAPRGKVA